MFQVSEIGTIIRVIPCFEKDNNGKRTAVIKGYIVDYLVSWEDDFGVHTSIKNIYVNLADFSDSEKQAFKEIYSDCLFKSYVFTFTMRDVGARPYFKAIYHNNACSVVDFEV